MNRRWGQVSAWSEPGEIAGSRTPVWCGTVQETTRALLRGRMAAADRPRPHCGVAESAYPRHRHLAPGHNRSAHCGGSSDSGAPVNPHSGAAKSSARTARTVKQWGASEARAIPSRAAFYPVPEIGMRGASRLAYTSFRRTLMKSVSSVVVTFPLLLWRRSGRPSGEPGRPPRRASRWWIQGLYNHPVG